MTSSRQVRLALVDAQEAAADLGGAAYTVFAGGRCACAVGTATCECFGRELGRRDRPPHPHTLSAKL